MATIPPINYGALKVSFPANLPRNEKDLICMLLAGRLKDLWNGKLICAQLAIDDLIKDLTGVSALKGLRDSLTKLKGSVDDFKRASGYDKILNGVNQALGQVGNVFSLGGLCPSPVTVPKIPDVLASLNQNLFGQANGILNALAQASNPKVCLGGGPKGFSLDWSKVTGDLKTLKNAIGEFKKNPAGFNATMQAFESNIKNQAKRMNSELKRLEQNLTDPLGINEKRNTASSVQRVKAVSDGFEVKDNKGIVYKNPARLMIPGEVDYVLNRTDPRYTTPIKYVTKPVYDYCGVLVGYTREVITGDPGYIGYDTLFTDLNVETPTANPKATYAEYDFFFKEENGQIVIYDTNANILNDLNISRGKHYRIGIEISSEDLTFGIYDVDDSLWKPGVTVTKEPEYGTGFEITTIDNPCNSLVVELDWAISIENPTTPDLLIWKTNKGQQGNIIVDGITSIPEEDKTYDVSMLLRKAWLNRIHSIENVANTNTSVKYETKATTRQYKISTKITKEDGSNIEKSSTIKFGTGLKVVTDTETFEGGYNINGGKIVIITQPLDNGQYFVIKKFINDDNGIELNQLAFYLTNGLPESDSDLQTHEQLAAIRFEEPVIALNDTRLPYTDYAKFNFSAGANGKLSNTTEHSIEKITNDDKTYLMFNLSSNRPENIESLSNNNFVYTSYIKIDPNDQARTFLDYNPIEDKCRIYIKGKNGFVIDCQIDYDQETIPDPITVQVRSSPTGSFLPVGTDTVPAYTFKKGIYIEPFRPIKINNGLPPYTFKITPELPPGMIFDVDTGSIRGTPTDFLDKTRYDITVDADDDTAFTVTFYVEVFITSSSIITMEMVNAAIAAAISQIQASSTNTLASAISQYTGGSPGRDPTVVGPGPSETPPQLLDPNNEYFSSAPGYVWGIDSAYPDSGARWYHVTPVAGYITSSWQQVDPVWSPSQAEWVWPDNTPGRPELAGQVATQYPGSVIPQPKPGG